MTLTGPSNKKSRRLGMLGIDSSCRNCMTHWELWEISLYIHFHRMGIYLYIYISIEWEYICIAIYISIEWELWENILLHTNSL